MEALEEMGYEVEVHPEGTQLELVLLGARGKGRRTCHPAQHLRGAYGDIGFARQPDGRLTAAWGRSIAILGAFR